METELVTGAVPETESLLESLDLKPEQDILALVDEAAQQIQEQEEPEFVPPKRTDPAWHDYVMSFFTQDEMTDNNPSADGLRRVAELLLGEITSSITNVVQAAGSGEFNNRATVVVTVTFDGIRTYSGAADSAPDNTDDVFRRYPTAIAETRAEGRALRKALNLRKVVSAEETSLIAREDTAGGGFMKIQVPQIKGIDVMCKKLDVNAEKFINMGTKKYDSIQDVEFETAIKMMQELNRYGVDAANNPDAKPVPEAIRGYVDGWRNSKE